MVPGFSFALRKNLRLVKRITI